jgi:aminoglycoside phosphotransferase (APT) family kinase protein
MAAPLPEPEVGPLIARGLDCDIFEYGSGRVLRKSRRSDRSLGLEARAIEYAARHGYPVPAVHELRAGGTEIVMERLDGPMMMDRMMIRPWTITSYASMLADLHDRLHEIPAPDWLPQMPDGGDALVHLDLHPMNVMLTSRGPVVIDWTNAARGEPLTDVALTYVLLTCPEIPGHPLLQHAVQPFRRFLAGRFARRYRGPAFTRRLAEAADLKTLDSNMSPRSVAACRRLAERAGARAAG